MFVDRHRSTLLASVPARCLYPDGQERAQSTGRGRKLTLWTVRRADLERGWTRELAAFGSEESEADDAH